MSDIATEMEKFLQLEKSASHKEEVENAEISLALMRSTTSLASAASNLESLNKEGEAKFLWKIINAAQKKLEVEINGPLRKEASAKEDSYQKYSEILGNL